MGDAAAAVVRLLLSVGRTRCAEPAATCLQSDTSSGVSNRGNEATRSPSTTQLGTGTQPAATTTSTTTTTQLGTSPPTAIGAQPGTKTQPASATPTVGDWRDPRGIWPRPRRERWFTANLGPLFIKPSDKQPRRLRQLRNSGTLKHHWSDIVAAVFMMVHTNAPCKLVCTFFKCSSQTVKRHVAKAQAERLKAWRLAQQLKRRLVESTASTAAASSTTASSTAASAAAAASSTAASSTTVSAAAASSTAAPAEVASAAYSKTGATHAAAAAGSPWAGSFWASNSRVHHIAIAPSSVHPSDLLVLVETSPKEKAVHQSEFTDDCFANQCNKAPWNCFADTNPEFWLKHDTSTGMVQPPSTCKAFFEKHAPKLVNVEYCNYALDVGFVASASKKSSSKAGSRGTRSFSSKGYGSDPKLVAATQAVVSAGGSGSGVGAGAKRRRNSIPDSVQHDVPQKLPRSTATGADHYNSAATMTGPHGSAVPGSAVPGSAGPGSAGPAAGHATAPRSAAWQASAFALAPAPATATAAATATAPEPRPATWYATSTAPGPGPAAWYNTTGPAAWYATTATATAPEPGPGPATWYATTTTTTTATATAGALGPADTVELAGMAAQIAQATQIVQTMQKIALTQQRLMDAMTSRMNVQS